MDINQQTTINKRAYTITAFDSEPYDNRGHQCVNLVDGKGNEKFAIFCNGEFEQWQRLPKAKKYSRVSGMSN